MSGNDIANDKSTEEKSEQFLRLENEIIPKIAEILGKDSKNLQCEIKVPPSNFFVSTIFVMDLIFQSDGGTENERVSLVVKMQPDNESSIDLAKLERLFHNEIIFYKYVRKNYTGYPECILAIPESTKGAVIVLENAMQFGYKSVNPMEELGMKRALAAVREIAKFHARGYVMKEKNPEEIFNVVEKLRHIYESSPPAMIEYINVISLRPVNYLRSVNFDPEFCGRISIPLSNAYEKILEDCAKPRNELAVLCHGDFTSNNVLFREDGAEFKAMLIDFAQLRYSSPATDLSTFLYLSCEDEVRKNFPVIFKAYHDAILEHLKEQGIQDLEKYSFDAFLKDYKRHAMYGCGTFLFFTPVLHLGYRVDFTEAMKHKDKYTKLLMDSGGDKLSKILADSLLEMKEHGCLDHMI